MPKRSIYDRNKMKHERNGEDVTTLDGTITVRISKVKNKAFKMAVLENDTMMSVVLNAFIDGYLDDKFSYNKETNMIEGM